MDRDVASAELVAADLVALSAAAIAPPRRGSVDAAVLGWTELVVLLSAVVVAAPALVASQRGSVEVRGLGLVELVVMRRQPPVPELQKRMGRLVSVL